MSTWVDLVQPISSAVSVIAVVGGGVFSFAKWLDVRRRELRQQRWEDYAKLLAVVSGGGRAPEQVAALFQLVEFKEYSSITIQTLNASNQILEQIGNAPWVAHMTPLTNRVVSLLKENATR